MDLGKFISLCKLMRGGGSMKLGDFKDNPERYQKMKNICGKKGIEVNDETDINDILEQKNSIDSAVNQMVKGSNRR